MPASTPGPFSRHPRIRRNLAAGLLAAVVGTMAAWPLTRIKPATGSAPGPTAALENPADSVRVFLEQYCYECHGDGAAKGGLALDHPEALTANDWDNTRRHVLLRTMPPDGSPRPAPVARGKFAEQLALWQAETDDPDLSPGFRRLSSREFASSLHTLLGIIIPSGDLPDSESAHGFDNNGSFQPLPPALLERCAALIRRAVTSALLPEPVPSVLRTISPREFSGGGSLALEAAALHESETAEPVEVPINPPVAGRYRFSLKAHAHQAGEEPVMVLMPDHTSSILRALARTAPDNVTIEISLPAGPRKLVYSLANPLSDPDNPDPHRRMRRVLVQEATLEGPLEGGTELSPGFAGIMGPAPHPDADIRTRLESVRKALADFLPRAWRRPVKDQELLRLGRLAGEAMGRGLRYDQALALAVEACLLSPHFLYLPDPAFLPPQERGPATAARLSYLLWSTIPDHELRRDSFEPWTETRVRRAAARLLEDPAAAAFARDFAGQWLQLRNTVLSQPDPVLFPSATPAVRASMKGSLEAFILHLFRENEPVLRLLDADYFFCDTGLAAFLELPTVPAWDGFRRVSLPEGGARQGLLGHPGVLMLTSQPNRTSPVLRGKYVLENLLGLEPPPPPPNVPTLSTAPPSGLSASDPHDSVRGALERHLADPSCASCHRVIDPLGLPMEVFDAVGRPASPGTAEPVTTFTGHELSGPESLHAWLASEYGTQIVRHTSARLLTYALGRGLTAREKLAAARLADQCGGASARFRDLLMAVVGSPEFRGDNEPTPQSSSPNRGF